MRILYVLFLLLLSSSLKSQYYDDSPQLVFSLDAAFPVNADAKLTNGLGLGGTTKLTIPLGEYSDLVLAGSIMSFTGKTFTKYGKTYKGARRNILPVMVGYRYYLSPLYNSNTWYVEPRVGVTIDGTKNQALTFGAALGYLINNKVDLSARYQSFSGQFNGLSFFSVGIGYSFSLN